VDEWSGGGWGKFIYYSIGNLLHQMLLAVIAVHAIYLEFPRTFLMNLKLVDANETFSSLDEKVCCQGTSYPGSLIVKVTCNLLAAYETSTQLNRISLKRIYVY
jgi:hypothetical protein